MALRFASFKRIGLLQVELTNADEGEMMPAMPVVQTQRPTASMHASLASASAASTVAYVCVALLNQILAEQSV